MKTTFGERLQMALDYRNKKASELANGTGLSQPLISQYLKDKFEAKNDKALLIARYLNVSVLWLMGLDDNMIDDSIITVDSNTKKQEDIHINSLDIIHSLTKIPVYAPLCCGSGLFVDDEIIDYVAIPTESLQSHKEYFGQYAKGDSMIGAGINDGDILIFEKINGIISQGQIGCFCIDENIATCKKMMIAEDSTVYLMPANENYPPITITVENSCFRCIGKLAFVVSDRRGK